MGDLPPTKMNSILYLVRHTENASYDSFDFGNAIVEKSN